MELCNYGICFAMGIECIWQWLICIRDMLHAENKANNIREKGKSDKKKKMQIKWAKTLVLSHICLLPDRILVASLTLYMNQVFRRDVGVNFVVVAFFSIFI